MVCTGLVFLCSCNNGGEEGEVATAQGVGPRSTIFRGHGLDFYEPYCSYIIWRCRRRLGSQQVHVGQYRSGFYVVFCPHCSRLCKCMTSTPGRDNFAPRNKAEDTHERDALFCRKLLAKGFHVPAIRPPTVPVGSSRYACFLLSGAFNQ